MLSLAIFPVEETFATFGMPSNRFLINVGLLHKKPTKIATCSEAIARRLDGRRCLRDHEHEHVLGGGKVTSTACLYTKELANEIILNLNNLNVKYLMKTMAVEEGDIEDDLDREIDPPMEVRDL